MTNFSGLGRKEIQWNIDKNPSLFQQLCQLDFDELVELGTQELKKTDELIQREISSSFVIQLGGPQYSFGKCLAVETKFGNMRSEMVR